MSLTRMTTLLISIFHLCPLIHICTLSWFLEHKSAAVRNILMVCGRIIEQVSAEGRMQERQLC